MRVLLLHNRYRQPGGEERSVSEIAKLLERRGHAVRVLERDSSTASRGQAAGALLAGGLHPHAVAAAVRAHRAEVVHAHNLHPLLGWRALAAARAEGARTILHLHNFRLFCAIGIAYRDGRPCRRCTGRNTLPGLRLRCRASLPEAAVYAAALATQQPRLLAEADRIVVLSRRHGELLRAHGLPWERVEVLPNFVAAWATESRAGEGRYALASGRLVEEKGFDTAITACRRAGVPLMLAGEGPDEPRLRRLARGGEVRFTGWVAPEELARLREGAAFALVPSRWEEACPYAVLEPLSAGVPVLVSDRGGLPELVGDRDGEPEPADEGGGRSDPARAGRFVLPAEDPAAWSEAVRTLWNDRDGRRSYGEAAIRDGREKFGEDAAYEGLMRLYGE